VAPNAIEAEIGKPEPDVPRIEQLACEMAAALDRFEKMLDGRDYLMGTDFSAADCCAFPFLKYALGREPEDDELLHRILDGYQQLGDDHPRLEDWIRRVDEHPRV